MMKMDAHFSERRVYRYRLDRVWSSKNHSRMVVIGLNPSTADETKDDPTIRRCIGFAKREGCGGLVMVNLFSLRATDPKVMKKHFEPIGADNDEWIAEAIMDSHKIIAVAAWGCHGSYRHRDAEVRRDIDQLGRTLYAFGLTKHGHPKHPLYLPSNTQLVEWPYDHR